MVIPIARRRLLPNRSNRREVVLRSKDLTPFLRKRLLVVPLSQITGYRSEEPMEAAGLLINTGIEKELICSTGVRTVP
jgi:hypothetical protein